jgi:hypothetical protein
VTSIKKSLMVTFVLLVLGASVFGGWSQAIAAVEGAASITKQVTGGKPFDINVGDGGMSSPSSMYSARLKLARVVPNNRTLGDKRFINRWIDISVVDDSAATARPVAGLVYVYFNLDRQTRPLWDAGELKIYYLDTDKHKWTECIVNALLPSKKAPLGRLACVATKFGRYGLATTGRLPQ